MVATLFEIIGFQEDNNVASVTSGQCQWIARAKPAMTTDAVEVHELEIGLSSDGIR